MEYFEKLLFIWGSLDLVKDLSGLVQAILDKLTINTINGVSDKSLLTRAWFAIKRLNGN